MVNSFNSISLHCYFQIFLLFTQLNCLHGAVTQSPSAACVGENITVSCVLTVLNAGDSFISRRTNFIINDTSNLILEESVDGNGTINGIDLSRFKAEAPIGSFTSLTGSITLISYQSSDENLLLGCSNEFTSIGSSDRTSLSQTLPLKQASPPSSPSLSTSLSTLSASECQGVSVSWLAPATDRAITQYYLYRDSSLISTLSNTTTQYTDTDTLILNAAYLYSLAVASCAGNSTMGSATAVITGYDLMVTTNSLCLQYNAVTNMIILNWDFSAPTPTTTLLIEYSLTLNYSHTQGNKTRTFSDSIPFSLLSSDARTFTQSLTPHSFVGGLEVETNITAVLRITQQCGQSYSGTQISCSISSPSPFNTGAVTQSPSVACVGENITVSCVLTLLTPGDSFISRRTNFIINDTSNLILEESVDGNGTINGIDLSRFKAEAPIGSFTSLTGSITLISYQSSDENLLLGCSNEFISIGSRTSLNQTLRLKQASPPSSPSLSTSLSTLSASECQGVSVSWQAPATDRAITQYYLYRNSSLISTLSNTTTQYTDTDPLTLNAAYLYSLAADSCAGNSTMGSATAVITGYDLMVTTNSLCLLHNAVTNMIILNWDFSAPTPTTTLLIEYSLTLDYSHTQGNETRTFSDSTPFSLLSSDARTSTQSLTPHSFVGGLEVETNITAVLRITQQCGQSYSGTQISCSISSTSISTLSTPVPTTTFPVPTSSSLNIGLLAGVLGGIVLFLIILGFVILIIGLSICFWKNRNDPQSAIRNILRRFKATSLKKCKSNSAKLRKDKKMNEVLYAELRHSIDISGVEKPSPIPPTKYAEISQF